MTQLEFADLDDEDFVELLRKEALCPDLSDGRATMLREAADRIAALAGDLLIEGFR